jgi:hypothetical protein
MPKRDNGKAVRENQGRDAIYAWRVAQLESEIQLESLKKEKRTRRLGKGKKPVRDQSKASGLARSPSITLAHLGKMKINAPSAAGSPADTPSDLPGDCPGPRPHSPTTTPAYEPAASTSAPRRRPRKHPSFCVEVPPSRLVPSLSRDSRSVSSRASGDAKAGLMAPRLQASRSSSSLASGDANKARLMAPRLQSSRSLSSRASDDVDKARIAALENQVATLRREVETLRAQMEITHKDIKTFLATRRK